MADNMDTSTIIISIIFVILTLILTIIYLKKTEIEAQKLILNDFKQNIKKCIGMIDTNTLILLYEKYKIQGNENIVACIEQELNIRNLKQGQ